jgi:hypothetical protein
MNKTLKWILISLGILVGLALIAMVVMHLIGFGGLRGSMMYDIDHTPYGLDRDGNFGGYSRNFPGMNRMPMRGMMPLMGLGILRGVLGLGVLVLAVIGVVLLVRNDKARRASAVPSAPVEVPQHSQRTCKYCAKPLETEWVACPHCGKKQ